MPNQPYWPWCAQPGAGRSTNLKVDQTDYGDGYNHRVTRGLNPARASWALSFPFTSLDELKTFDDFLIANAARGFWITPPDSTVDVFVVADAWSATIIDKTGSGALVGTLQANFTRQYNPQPAS
jgi:phage-related protein